MELYFRQSVIAINAINFTKKILKNLSQIANMFNYLCNDNKFYSWMSGQLTFICHFTSVVISTLIAVSLSYITGIDDNYCQGNYLQAIIFGKCYICSMSIIVCMGLPILGKNNCLQTVLKKLSNYDVGHPIPEVELYNEAIYMRKIFSILPLVRCSNYKLHSQSVPIAIIALRPDQILENIRLDYKNSNKLFKQYMAYISSIGIVLILADIFISIGDGAFVIITLISNPSNVTFYEQWITILDRIWMIAIKLLVMGYMSYCGSLITIQVK